MWDLAKGCASYVKCEIQRTIVTQNAWYFLFRGNPPNLSAFKINTLAVWSWGRGNGVWSCLLEGRLGQVRLCLLQLVVPQVKLQIAKLAFCICEPEPEPVSQPWRFHLCDQLTRPADPQLCHCLLKLRPDGLLLAFEFILCRVLTFENALNCNLY